MGMMPNQIRINKKKNGNIERKKVSEIHGQEKKPTKKKIKSVNPCGWK